MLSLILALAIAEPTPAAAPAEPVAASEVMASETVMAAGAVTPAKTPAGPHWVCKWRAHSTGIAIQIGRAHV